MALGAVIMLVGMVAGSVFSPSLKAQGDSKIGEIKMFDNIVCKTLSVTEGIVCSGGLTILNEDELLSTGIELLSNKNGNTIAIHSPLGLDKGGITLSTALSGIGQGNRMIVWDTESAKPAMELSSTESANIIQLENKKGKDAISMGATNVGNAIDVSDTEECDAIQIGSYGSAINSIMVDDEAKRIKWRNPER